MPPRSKLDDALSRLEAQEIYRRIEALASRVGDLAGNIGVLDEKDANVLDKVNQLSKDVRQLSDDIAVIKDLLSGVRGGFRIIIMIGTAVGVVVGGVLARNDWVAKIFGGH